MCEKSKSAKEIKAEFIEKMKKAGIHVYKNNIDKAKPLREVCGSIKTKYPASAKELIYGK